MQKRIFIWLSLLTFIFTAFVQLNEKALPPLEKLSDYGFFEGKIAAQKPVKGVVPYTLNTPLFTDYAEKLRFVKLPEGQKAVYNETEVLDFPVGTTIIKTFYYPLDFRKPEKGRQIIETRLLIREKTGWKALVYVWNDEQTDAILDVAGSIKEVKYTYLDGKKKKHLYGIPNLNQCKGCHNRNEIMSPIGPSARQLSRQLQQEALTYSPASFAGYDPAENQLNAWSKSGILEGLPGKLPVAVVWNNAATGSVEQRAKMWLDINCAHCHRPEGPASTSGLNLSIHNEDPVTYGISKTPVASGRGSGNLMHDIVPGKPSESILIYRMESTDPGVMMPEVGRKTVHVEGVALVKEWILGLK